MNRITSTSRRARLVALGTTTVLAAGLVVVAAAPAHAAAPVGGADAYTTVADATLTVGSPGLFGNDTDPEGDAIAIHSVWPPAGGPLPGEELQTTPGGGFAYTPPAGYTGTRVWQYRLQDAAEVSDYIDIAFTVTAAPNQAPIGVADSFSTPKDTQLVIPAPGLLANDSDPDGDALAVSSTGGYPAGEFIAAVDGGFTFNPPAGFEGTKQYYYYLTDGEATSAQVPITITVGDAPVELQAPVAVADSFTVGAGQTLEVAAPGLFANDSDADSGFVVFSSGSVSHGVLDLTYATGAFTYTPEPGFVGTDSFFYDLTDVNGLHSAQVTVTIEVLPASNSAPVTVADAYAVVAGQVFVAGGLGSPDSGVLDNDSDPDGDTLVVTSWTAPPGGLLPGEVLAITPGGALEYHAPAGFVGGRTFGYSATDGQASTSGSIVFAVSAAPIVNAAPIAVGDTIAVESGASVTSAAPGVLGNDTDADGDPLQVVSHTVPAGGLLPGESFSLAADGSLLYTAPSGYSGVRQFGYTVSDGVVESAPAIIRFTVRDPDSDNPTEPSDPPAPGVPTLPGRPESGGEPRLAETGVDAGAPALTAGLGALLLALGLLARRRTRRAA